MDRNGAKDRQALRRIVALLVALAALAERAGTRPRPVRVAVLWLLRLAESTASDFVIAVARETGAGPDFAVSTCAYEIADDAGRLAQSFKALAALLADLAGRGASQLPAGRINGPAAHLMRTLRNLADAPAMRACPSADTS